ncbi:MAG: hypothetical protein QOD63_1232 [Actinomycetota bacterium]|nr:hypothetical protein [Actinomycetota bacterium]
MTTDAFLVAGLFGFIWAAVLIPPVADARAARRDEFLGSIRPGDHDGLGPERRRSAPLSPKARRRQILGGLLVAMAATLFLGLLPTFRLMLAVHLLLVDSFLAYVGLLVLLRDREARRAPAVIDSPPVPGRVIAEPFRREAQRAPAFGDVVVAAPRAVIADLATSA